MMPFQLYFILTLSCNLRCPHCIREFAKDNPKNLIDSKSFSDICLQVKKRIPNAQIVLTGGEPTCHKDFFDILDSAVSVFGVPSICTNGIFSVETLKRLCGYKSVLVQVSLDGDETVHDKIRGNGNFKKSLCSIKSLIANDIKVSVSTTVSKENVDSIFKLADILSEISLSSWQIAMEQTFNEFENKKRLNSIEWNSFVDKIVLYARNPLKIKKIFDFELFERMEKKLGIDNISRKSVSNCGFCKSKIYIYPDLSVRGCTCIPEIKFGNLSENSLEDIMKEMVKKRSCLNPKKQSPCFSCQWSYFCNGGCPGYSYHFKGDVGFGDIRCPIVEKAYEL